MNPEQTKKTDIQPPVAPARMPAHLIPQQVVNVLGLGANGKTCLVQALAGKPFAKSDTTWGLRQSIVELGGQPVLFQDFQGKDDTFQIQSLGGALTPPGMILLVMDGGGLYGGPHTATASGIKAAFISGLSATLRTLNVRSAAFTHMPLVLTITKTDTFEGFHRQDIEHGFQTVQAEFPNLKQMCFASAKTGEGIGKLKAALLQHVPPIREIDIVKEDRIAAVAACMHRHLSSAMNLSDLQTTISCKLKLPEADVAIWLSELQSRRQLLILDQTDSPEKLAFSPSWFAAVTDRLLNSGTLRHIYMVDDDTLVAELGKQRIKGNCKALAKALIAQGMLICNRDGLLMIPGNMPFKEARLTDEQRKHSWGIESDFGPVQPVQVYNRLLQRFLLVPDVEIVALNKYRCHLRMKEMNILLQQSKTGPEQEPQYLLQVLLSFHETSFVTAALKDLWSKINCISAELKFPRPPSRIKIPGTGNEFVDPEHLRCSYLGYGFPFLTRDHVQIPVDELKKILSVYGC